jgi:hypothetical protein
MYKPRYVAALLKQSLHELQADRLQSLEEQMASANEDYAVALNRASTNQDSLSCLRIVSHYPCITLENLHAQISAVLRTMLGDTSETLEMT